jgi:hypothetical protein
VTEPANKTIDISSLEEHDDSNPEHGRATQRKRSCESQYPRDLKRKVIDVDGGDAFVAVVVTANEIESKKIVLERTKLQLDMLNMLGLSDKEKKKRISELYNRLEAI